MRVSEIAGLRNEWYAVALTDGIEDRRLQTVHLFGEEYVLFVPRTGSPALFAPFCPHRGANLAAGVPLDETIQCCYHGWEFGTDGACKKIPQLDESTPIPSRARVRTWPVVERYGMYWACVGVPAADGPPGWYEADELGWRVNVDFFEPWKACALRIIDNNIDQTHPAFVHQNTFGDPTKPRIPKYDLQHTERGFQARIAHTVGGVGPQMGDADESAFYERITEVELLSPVQSRILLTYEGRAHDYCFYGSATPIDDEHAMYVRISALASDEEAQPYQMFWEFSRRVTLEDQVVLETTHPDFPVELTSEIHTQPDKTTIEYRRILGRLVTDDRPPLAAVPEERVS
jgi:phenylpropionate dioxygenase-like ring-hydroxylating dioxygenase large terminal subunit